ncbi:unnamed protein product [Prorocentrum cordatum]|uniref:Uncharacterized protein n=1 Tax=Prorocentrum cordatum TaxID=2364126 RepID=A0ABN9WYC8_9DINO|nr:unnamed protein product [Polarella glacialis]
MAPAVATTTITSMRTTVRNTFLELLADGDAEDGAVSVPLRRTSSSPCLLTYGAGARQDRPDAQPLRVVLSPPMCAPEVWTTSPEPVFCPESVFDGSRGPARAPRVRKRPQTRRSKFCWSAGSLDRSPMTSPARTWGQTWRATTPRTTTSAASGGPPGARRRRCRAPATSCMSSRGPARPPRRGPTAAPSGSPASATSSSSRPTASPPRQPATRQSVTLTPATRAPRSPAA